MANGKENAATAAEDIFSRPSEFRQSTVLAVWEKGKSVRGKPNHRYDWRNGNVVGPWEPGQSRDGVWDVGHIEPWYKVVERLKKVKGVTREMVLDEFNDLDNLGVEDPETNRKLGVNSRVMGVDRLPYKEEEKALFEDKHEHDRHGLLDNFHRQIEEKSAHVEQRVQRYNMREASMTKETEATENTVELPKRVIVWDTETTGLSTKNGDKIVEIGAIEMIDGKPTGKQYHQYLNPERSIPKRATDVHGITDEMVKDMPTFKEVADEFLEFVGDAPMVAHNASFDMRFINAELEAAGKEPIGDERKIDSLRIARKVFPDFDKHTLDVLAEHYGVDTSARDESHGGLVDTIILGEVYAKLSQDAKDKGVDVMNLDADKKKAKAYIAGDTDDREFEKAARWEQAMQQEWLAAHGKADIELTEAPTDRSGGFAERLREELARQANERGGVSL
jgi:DNA polymerase III subunit epsilon